MLIYDPLGTKKPGCLGKEPTKLVSCRVRRNLRKVTSSSLPVFFVPSDCLFFFFSPLFFPSFWKIILFFLFAKAKFPIRVVMDPLGLNRFQGR